MLYYRHRRNNFTLSEPSVFRRALRPAIGILLALAVLYVSGDWLLKKTGFGNHSRQTAVVLSIEKRAGVLVSVDGKEFVSAQDQMKLYSADRVRTGPNAAAAVRFFDGTVLRLSDQTEITLVTSDQKSDDSVISVHLTDGKVWVFTPMASSYSGSILRSLVAGDLTFQFPAHTDAMISARSATVYSAAGLGIQVDIPHAPIPIIIGEGQQFALPENYNPDEDLYQYRSPLASISAPSAFVEESRSLYSVQKPSVPAGASGSVMIGATDLSVISPINDSTVQTSTVEVKGSVSEKVTGVRINGYLATIAGDRSFTLEVTLPDEDKVTITVEALDAQGNVLETTLRELTRDRKPPAAPTITNPAKNGETYRTQSSEIEISGTAPAGAAAIIVNDYRLQLFKLGDTTWTYLAGTKLQNLQQGTNIFTVTSMNESGVKSEPAVLTIILGEGAEGVIVPAVGASSSTSDIVSEDQLPQNPPLQPGTVRVTGPKEGSEFTSTGSAFLLEGTVMPLANSVWVNGYKLKLYTPGKLFWNYIADPAFGTLKKGVNTYRINVRDAAGYLLDTTTYTVTY